VAPQPDAPAVLELRAHAGTGLCLVDISHSQEGLSEQGRYFAALKRHMVFYNTNPAIGSPTIFGAACALEEKKQPEVSDSLKVSLMGPFAGIGDTVMAILMKPIFAVFAASMALRGSTGGAWLMLALGFIWFYLMFPGFWLGYKQGLGWCTR